MQAVPLLLALPLFLWSAWTDYRFMRIRNVVVLAALAVFVLTVPFIGVQEALYRGLAALLVFAVAFSMFAVRALGGGDVKLGSAMLLFVPSGTYTLFAYAFSLALLVTIVGFTAARRMLVQGRSGAVSMRAKGMVPMGVAFALAGTFHLCVLAALG